MVAEQCSATGLTIPSGALGYSYETVIEPYLQGAKEVRLEDPYIRAPYQLRNFVMFCESVVHVQTVRILTLVTTFDMILKIPNSIFINGPSGWMKSRTV